MIKMKKNYESINELKDAIISMKGIGTIQKEMFLNHLSQETEFGMATLEIMEEITEEEDEFIRNFYIELIARAMSLEYRVYKEEYKR